MRAELRGSVPCVVRVLCLLVLGPLSGCYESAESYGGDSHFLRPCERQAQCDDLGDGYTCEDGHCQPPLEPVADAGRQDGPAPVATGDGEGAPAALPGEGSVGAGTPAAEQVAPLVLLLVDTSGSMERLPGCVCDDLACVNCLPACDPSGEGSEKSRWTQTLEALTGTYRGFSCEAVERTPENGATYDVGYYLPYHQPAGVQEDDGVLDLYRERLRFGVATFDTMETYVGADRLIPVDVINLPLSAGEQGGFSYVPSLEIEGTLDIDWPIGVFHYPNCTSHYFMDTGIRNTRAAEGGLRLATDPARALEVNDVIQLDLPTVRPFGGTPIAAALDDLFYVLERDAMMAEERARDVPRHVVLITDGEPDKDYRDLGCDCNQGGSPLRCGPPPNDPAMMRCPYPEPEAAARALRCGHYTFGCDGPATALHVIGLDVGHDATVVERLDAVAAHGGTDRARHAANGAELRAELIALFDTIEP